MNTFYDPRETVLRALDDTHTLMHVEPSLVPAFGDLSANYVIPIPNGWHTSRSMGHDTQHPTAPNPIGLFAPQTSHVDLPHILVTVQRVPENIDAHRLTEDMIRSLRWEIVRSEVNDTGRFEICALGRMFDKAYARRVVGFLDGRRLFRIESFCPLEDWPKFHDMMWPCGFLMQLEEVAS